MLKRLWHRFLQIKKPAIPSIDFQLGYHNGYWAGVLQGRKDALTDLDADLAAHGKSLNEVELDDVARARTRMVH